MARKQSGGLNRFLNFIGLVDDAAPREAYSEEYDSSSYGRPSTYVPPRQRTSASGRRDTAARKSLPAQGGPQQLHFAHLWRGRRTPRKPQERALERLFL